LRDDQPADREDGKAVDLPVAEHRQHTVAELRNDGLRHRRGDAVHQARRHAEECGTGIVGDVARNRDAREHQRE
jgi:hypothetical protein